MVSFADVVRLKNQSDVEKGKVVRWHAACNFAGASTTVILFSALEGTMEQRCDTAKRYLNTRYQSLAKQIIELRELRKLVRNAEAKRRNRRRAPRLAGGGLFKAQNSV
jgi:hypothetical protein